MHSTKKFSTSSKYSNISSTISTASSSIMQLISPTSNTKNGAENRTVTLKARVLDLEKLEAKVFVLMNTIGYLTKKTDVYFNVPNGQLKLRFTTNLHQKTTTVIK